MQNPLRGDVTLTINGSQRTMRLTLGALAMLEEKLDTGSLLELAERFDGGRVRANDLMALLVAGLAGAGETELGEVELRKAEISGGVVAATQAGLDLLARAFAPLGDG